MFGLLHNLFKAIKSQRERRYTVVLIGLDNAGKTTVARHLRGEAASAGATPTFGFNSDVLGKEHGVSAGGGVFSRSLTVEMFDLGGGKNIRGIWGRYYAEVHGVVYVVDAADTDRIEEAAACLADSLKDPHLDGKPLLVLANKQDLPSAMAEADAAQALGLASGSTMAGELGERAFNIVGCTALYELSEEGGRADPRLRRALRWLLGAIGSDWTQLAPRVKSDVVAQKEKDAKELAERKARVAKMREERARRQEEEERMAAAEAEAVERGEFLGAGVSPPTEVEVSAAPTTPMSAERVQNLAQAPTAVVDLQVEAGGGMDVDEVSAPEAATRKGNPVADGGGRMDQSAIPTAPAANPNALESPRTSPGTAPGAMQSSQRQEAPLESLPNTVL